MAIEFNNYSDKDRKKLKPGEKVTYELYGLKKDPQDPEKNPKKQRWLIPFKKGVPSQDRIFDKGSEEYIDIAYISKVKAGGEVETGEIIFEKREQGLLHLIGGRSDDDKKFEFMENSNFNGSNSARDTSKPILYIRKDYKKENELIRRDRKLRVAAINASLEMNIATVRKTYLGLFGNVDDNEDKMRGRLEAFAESDPEKFLGTLENTDLNIMEIAETAEKKGIISFDMQARRIISNGSTLYVWKPEKDVNKYEKFVEFVKSDEGNAFYQELKENLKKKK